MSEWQITLAFMVAATGVAMLWAIAKALEQIAKHLEKIANRKP